MKPVLFDYKNKRVLVVRRLTGILCAKIEWVNWKDFSLMELEEIRHELTKTNR